MVVAVLTSVFAEVVVLILFQRRMLSTSSHYPEAHCGFPVSLEVPLEVLNLSQLDPHSYISSPSIFQNHG